LGRIPLEYGLLFPRFSGQRKDVLPLVSFPEEKMLRTPGLLFCVVEKAMILGCQFARYHPGGCSEKTELYFFIKSALATFLFYPSSVFFFYLILPLLAERTQHFPEVSYPGINPIIAAVATFLPNPGHFSCPRTSSRG